MQKIIIVLLILTINTLAKNYTHKANVQSFIKKAHKEHRISTQQLNRLFSNVKVQKSALAVFLPANKRPRVKDRRTKEQIARAKKIRQKYGSWERYRMRVVTPKRINNGVALIKNHKAIFEKVEKRYGVPREIITAIIGIESAYGKNVGKYPVFDTLATLGFEKNRRNRFFRKELSAFLGLCKRQNINPKNVYGSYAGAIGLGQFMPSNYAAYGVDFNGDGKVTLQRKPDAIASIANYFKKNGWRKGEPIATRVSYKGNRFNRYKTGHRTSYWRKQLKGIAPKKYWSYNGKVRVIKLKNKKYDELWYGAKNFYVITRYNHSDYYAMAVYQLATKIKEKL